MASRQVTVAGNKMSKTELPSASLPGREDNLSARPGNGTHVNGEAQIQNTAEKPFTILVVDDSPHILQAIQDFLPDYNVITAGSGEAALRRLLRNHVNLVLLDVRMDGMDGIETATRIRERKQSENIPIIFMSGIDKSDYQVFEGYQAGGIDYIFKPFTPEILRAKIFVFSQLFRTTEELKASEAQLVRKNRELRKRSADLERQAELLDLARNAIIVMDLEGRISFWNAGAETMYGWAKESVKGKGVHDLLHTSFSEPLEGIMARLMAEGAWTGELVHTAKDGRQVTVESQWTLRRGENEERPEIMEISMDITERKRLEEHIRQAQKMEAIGTMAGGIAHDFNNILAAVIGFTEMSLDDAPKGSPLEKNLRWILQSGMRGKDLVKQIVAFSRKNEPHRGPLRLSPVIDETVNLLRAAIPSSIRVEVHNRAGTDTVFASSGEIQQVILNLCTNAVHAMREDVGILTIELSDAEPGCAELPINPGLPPGSCLQLSVTDTGTGMDAAVKGRIFEPFFTTKEKGKGTGMGLAVVYGIVKGLNGEVTVESAPGRGATFRVFLPRIDVGEASGETYIEPIPGGTERILLIDDEEALVEMGRRMLESLGYKVTAITDSREALRVFSEDPERFDLVFTDQTMPGMTGVQLAGHFQKMREDLPIILCTGHSDNVSAKSAPAKGISAFLMKPLVKREMAETVRKVLGHT